MSQLLDALIGMDPAGDGALLLCTIVAAALGVVIVVGFGLVRPPSRVPMSGPKKRRASTAADLDVLELWRLKRSLGKRAGPRSSDSPAVDSVGTPP